MRKYTIQQELIDEYVKRETNKKMAIISITLLMFFLFMFFYSSSHNFQLIMMLPTGVLFLIFLAWTYISISAQTKNLIASTYFVFSDESISRLLDYEKLNLITEIGLSRNEHKYGMEYNQTIKFSDIESTSIDENEIIITSRNSESITRNGIISIPKEMENYECIKSEIIENSDKYKLSLPVDSN